ncbi:MAG: Trk system potassium transporter TrkA [Gammaproteobacteria bacterium]|nr:Trk system potassium transporter TrkA [Gammaproteobacteria bacterium]
MKIVILGAGQVGSTLAEHLAAEHHDITVVDRREAAIGGLRERLDVRCVIGHASHPATLRRAGGEDADLIVAVTDSDETNMLACRIAQTLFHTPAKVARVRAEQYLSEGATLFAADALAVDLRISPEQLVTDSIRRLIEYPGSLQVLDFADGRVGLVDVRAYYGGPLVGRQLKELPERLPPGVEARVAAIYRRGKPIIPEGDTVIEAEDDVFFIADSRHIGDIMGELRRLQRPARRTLIAGGGNIGLRLAQALSGHVQVKLIERDRVRAEWLSAQLDHVVVLAGDAANEELLEEENIADCDVFCAVTNDDEANILSAMLAKRLGAHQTLSLINRMAYVDLVEGGAVDVAISPQQATVSALLAHVRRGDLVKVHTLRRGAAEAIEAVVHGDRSSSRIVGRRLDEIKLPPGTTIGAIVRGEEVLIAHHDTVVESEDHLILFVIDKKRARDVEKLFQVGIGFV